MKCTTCGYTLWNLESRTCPECGSPFHPSEFTFRPNSVRYLCPGCKQDYYGTSHNGHLVPSSFACVRCERPLSMDEMILLPAEGIAESDTRLYEMPWTAPEQRSLFKRWFQTVVMAMIRPGDLIRAVPDAPSTAPAFRFLAVNFGILLALQLIFTVLCLGGLFLVLSQTNPGGAGAGGAGLGPAMIPQLILQFIVMFATFLLVALWALLTHGVLRITGSIDGTWHTTANAILYSSGAYMVSLVPCVGSFAGIWWIVSATIMVCYGQKVSGLRATFATLTPPLVAIALLVAGWFALIFAIAGAGGAFAGAATTAFQRDTTTLYEVHAAIQDRALAQGGWGAADHAALLILDGHLEPWQLLGDDTVTQLKDVPFLAGTLEDLDSPDAETLAQARDALPLLPENVVAHRVGDFVFTYHGVDASDPPHGIWIVIENDMTGALPDAHALDAFGTPQIILPFMRAEVIEAQNALRATHGLPPIPDPATVKNGSPAVNDADASP